MKKISYNLLKFIFLGFLVVNAFYVNASNTLSVKSIEVLQGQNFTIEIEMQNSNQIAGFQFDIELPNEIIFQDDDAILSDRKNDHSFIISPITTNKFRIISWSTSQSTYSDNSGTIITIPCKLPLSVSTGNYKISLSNCILGNASSINVIDNYEHGTLTVLSSNNPPVANAGIDQTIDELTLVTLNGSDSNDPDGDQITYSWTAPVGITLNNTSTSNPTFTAPEVTTDTDYTFTLTVSDGQLSSDTDEVIITVKQVNKIPVADAGTNQNVSVGDLVTLDASGSYDEDEDKLTYLWSAPEEINLNSNTNVQPAFIVPSISVSKEFPIVLTVNDGFSNSTPDTVFIHVEVNNQQPLANAGDDQTVNEGELVTLNGSLSYDPDGDEITYVWTAPEGITLNDTNIANPTFTAPEVITDTEYIFILTINDGQLNSMADTVLINILDATNSVDFISNNEAFKIYPNPASNFVNIEIDQNLVGRTMKVFSVTGQLMSSQNLTSKFSKIDISRFKEGFYTFSIKGESKLILKTD